MSEKEEVVNIRFSIPTPQSRGFLRRQEKTAAFMESIKAGDFTVKLVHDMTNFFAGYVEGSTDHNTIRDFVQDASEEEIMSLLTAISGGGQDAEVPPQ